MLPHWSRIEIDQKPVDLLEPRDALPYTLIWLHDENGDTPATDAAITAELQARRLRCLAPQAGRSWWVDRLCEEFDPRMSAERYIVDCLLPHIHMRPVALVGIGMGGQGALRLGFRHPGRLPIVASLDGAFDFHEIYGQGTPLDGMYSSREQARQDTAILQIHGHDWPSHIWFACSPRNQWHRGNDRLHEKLNAMGVPHTASLDSLTPNALQVAPMLTIVTEALQKESRRLA